MLVYGDHTFEGKLQALRMRLYALVTSALENYTSPNHLSVNPGNLDSLRTLLILCGQVEQGAHDTLVQALPAHEATRLIMRFHQATAHAAEAFYSVACSQPVALPLPVVDTTTALRRLLDTLDALYNTPDLSLTIKLPEGFSLYALYPEQYLIAAAQWLAEHSQQQACGALVVGIRSIGTTLAAVVSAVLRAQGWQVQSLTVRPTGHPYTRHVEISGVKINPSAWALIVDEGPGISGSSMAATASALVQAGVDRSHIAFLPGHPNNPGGAGSEEVQVWWQTTPRYVADVKSLVFNTLSLQEALAATLSEPVYRIEDFSSGQWRHAVYADAKVWPAICTAFERIKYRYTLQSGKRVIFKFLGLASTSPDLTPTAESMAALLRARAAQGLAAPVLGVAYGFVATEWIEGTPLSRDVLSPALVDTLGAYMARVAGSSMADGEARVAIERLTEMLHVNIGESFGDEAAELLPRYQPSDHPSARDLQSTYGDGHMQPYEWIVDRANQLHKVDSVGHESDHTLVGQQSVAWDIAGAIVEWRLEDDAIERLLKAFTAAGGVYLELDTLNFYRAAYLALRLGACSLAAQVHDPHERDRLLNASAIYRQQLANLLRVDLPSDLSAAGT
jgi:hypothetical protein